VRETLTTLLADPQYLGAQPGIIAALPPWSQTLVLLGSIPRTSMAGLPFDLQAHLPTV
jgi:hypothetical protein